MQVAYALGRRCLPDHTSRFSRRDFTLPQLFACLVVRELFGLSYRRAEALLADAPAWLADVGLRKAPDHNTLWRAAAALVSGRRTGRMLDLLAELFAAAKLLASARRRGGKGPHKPLAIDSTCYEQRHRSRHYDRRCRHLARKGQDRPGKWGERVNAARGRRVRVLPKLAVAVDGGCHLILAAKVRIGNGSDAPDFDDLLYHAWRRAGVGGVRAVVADAGYDSEANHRIARQDMGVRSIIATGIGRPTSRPPAGRWRRHVKRRLSSNAASPNADQKLYAQRSQSETAHSMMKRNLSSALRARTPARQKKEMMLRVLVHNITLLCDELEG